MIKWLPLPAAALLLLAVVITSQPTTKPLQVATVSDDRTQWAIDFAAALGNRQPSADTIAFIVAWTLAEGTTAAYNPLATTQNAPGATNFNSVGVKNFVSREQGLAATVETITNGYYPNVLQGLQTNNPEQALNGSELATWGTGRGNVETIYRRAPQALSEAPQATIRANLVNYALSLVGIPYVRGGRSAAGGDCSGTMQHIYLQVAGIDIGSTTFDQYPRLQPIDISEAQPGDLWFGQFSDDQHTGMMADVNADGVWDLVHNGADEGRMHVTYSFLTESYLGSHTMGFRRAL